MPQIPLAIQLYTLRELTDSDFAATVRQVAEMGYQGVELAGYGNLAGPEQVKRTLDDLNLRICGSHVPIERLETDLPHVLADLHTLNCDSVICPWLPPQRRQSTDAWKRAAQSLNQIGSACRERGIEFCYHNHSFEFEPANGICGMDLLLQHTEPALVKFELDVFWLTHGGQDPVACLKKLAGRVPLVHLKDMASGSQDRFAPVGQGVIDFTEILSAAQQAGVRWGIIEQDDCYDTPPLEVARTSLQHLRSLNGV